MIDDVDDGSLSEEDLQAARAVIERFPNLVGENTEESLRVCEFFKCATMTGREISIS